MVDCNYLYVILGTASYKNLNPTVKMPSRIYYADKYYDEEFEYR